MSDTPQTNLQSICLCRIMYGFDCQFPDFPVENLNGNPWCVFHLPLRDARGFESNKLHRVAGWEMNGRSRKIFDAEIRRRLNLVQGNLRKVVFPPDYAFTNYNNAIEPNFTEAVFGNGVSFTGVNFGFNSLFQHAVFGDRVTFAGVTFGQNVRFDHARFGDNSNFTEATFSGTANFSYAIFAQSTVFRGAIFGEATDFQGASFGNDTDFSHATFGENSTVSVVSSAHHTFFDNAKFMGRTSFQKAKFLGEVTFGGSEVVGIKPQFQHINFSNSEFHHLCSFENRAFKAGVSFDYVVFENLVEFHGCDFHEGMSFHNTYFLKTKGPNDADTAKLEQAYRTLKYKMENLRARNEEAKFFALEMECRRNRKNAPWYERLAATLYKNLSEYGQALDLPLLWLLVLANISFLAFGIVALVTDVPDAVHLVGFTFEQMFRPFYVWSMSPVGTAPELVKCNRLIIPLLASVQSLATIGFLTLFLLALRRRFKMD